MSTGVSLHRARILEAVLTTKGTGVSGQTASMASRMISLKSSVHALESIWFRCASYVKIYLRGRIDAEFQRAQTAGRTVAPAFG